VFGPHETVGEQPRRSVHRCEQLWQQKGEPKSEEEQRAVNFLRNDPQARTAFSQQGRGSHR